MSDSGHSRKKAKPLMVRILSFDLNSQTARPGNTMSTRFPEDTWEMCAKVLILPVFVLGYILLTPKTNMSGVRRTPGYLLSNPVNPTNVLQVPLSILSSALLS